MTMTKSMPFFVFAGILAVVVLTACVSPPSAPDPTVFPTATRASTATPRPTAAPTPTDTPSPTDTPLPTDTLAPTPTLTPLPATTPVPTFTPRPLPAERNDVPARPSDEEIAAAVLENMHEFLAAALGGQEPDVPRALATYSQACREGVGNVEEFRLYVNDLRNFLHGSDVEIEIWNVAWLDDDQVGITSQLLKDGAEVLGLDRALFILENGRWLNAAC